MEYKSLNNAADYQFSDSWNVIPMTDNQRKSTFCCGHLTIRANRNFLYIKDGNTAYCIDKSKILYTEVVSAGIDPVTLFLAFIVLVSVNCLWFIPLLISSIINNDSAIHWSPFVFVLGVLVPLILIAIVLLILRTRYFYVVFRDNKYIRVTFRAIDLSKDEYYPFMNMSMLNEPLAV